MSDTLDHPSFSSSQREELLRFLTWKLGCRDLAADVAQEAYLRLSRFRASDQEVKHPRQFLFSIASNLVIDHIRRKKLETKIFTPEQISLDYPSTEPGSERAIDAKQRLAIVESAAKELSTKCRQALFLNRVEGLTHADIAQKLGVSESMVAKYIGQAIRHCRNRLKAAEAHDFDDSGGVQEF